MIISTLKNNHDPYPLLRGLIIEKSIEFDVLLFDQELRSHGKSSYSFFDYFQYGVLSFVRHSRKFLRLIILIGFLLGIASFFTAITFLVYKLLNWNDFSVGIAPIIIGVFGLGSFQIFLIGILGEYLITLQDYYLTEFDFLLLSQNFNLPLILVCNTNIPGINSKTISFIKNPDKTDNCFIIFELFFNANCS